MNLAEITHRAYFLDCYPLDERHLKISIQTGKDVDEVILWAGDPYSEMYTVPSLHRRTAGSSTILRSPAAGRASACLRMDLQKTQSIFRRTG